MKIAYRSIPKFKIILAFFLFSPLIINAQESSEILDLYEDYTEPAREVVYMHLNKSTYIKGESIGFTAYVMDKKDKNPSLLTANLYVSIEDQNNKVIKQKLIKVDNGVSSNTFELDSLFTSGYYNVKAYTNWMLNFKEQNYFTESIRIIDPENEIYIKKEVIKNDIDAQFLPESGHLLHGVVNTIGVVIKDDLGFGLPYAKGEVFDKNNDLLTTFETNQFGISKFLLSADMSNSYNVKLNHNNTDFSFKLNQEIEDKGIIMSLKYLKSKVFLSLITNQETLGTIKGKKHTLMIHNGDNHNMIDVYFNDETVITKTLDYDNIVTGINILTLFNENDSPIAERLFFNYEGINTITSNEISATRVQDSVTLNLNFKALDTRSFNSISISILPQETESYKRHHNIISYTYLQPYVNGAIEQAKYYFTDFNARKQYELDNLLLTQGWSSYNWDAIFKNKAYINHAFEQGITLNANINNEEHLKDTYVLHQFSNHLPSYFQAKDGDTNFVLQNVYPVGDESIFLSRITSNETLRPAQLYVQALPNRIPKLNASSSSLNPKARYQTEVNFSKINMSFPNADNVQKLEEVVVKSKLNEKHVRMQKLSKHSHSSIKIVNDMDRLSYLTLGDFLRFQNNLNVVEEMGAFSVYIKGGAVNPFVSTGSRGMLIYLDDAPLQDTDFLYRYPLDNIDYVEINRNGLGYGVLGSRGILKIYSNFDPLIRNRRDKTVQEVKLPLVFSAKKTFYVPKYQYYNDDFYKAYGTIDWKPELSSDNNGNISLKMAQPKVPITLFIEGIANDGSYIFEEKTITVN